MKKVPKSKAGEWKAFNKIFAGKGPSHKWTGAYEEALTTIKLSRKERYKTWCVAYRVKPPKPKTPATPRTPGGGRGRGIRTPRTVRFAPIAKPRKSRKPPKAGPLSAKAMVELDVAVEPEDLPSGWSKFTSSDGKVRYSNLQRLTFSSAFDVAEHLLEATAESAKCRRRRNSVGANVTATSEGDEEVGWLVDSLSQARRRGLMDVGGDSQAGPLDGDVRYFSDETLPADWLVRQGPGAPSYMHWPRAGRAPLPDEHAPLHASRRELMDSAEEAGGSHPVNELEHFVRSVAFKCGAKRKEQLARQTEDVQDDPFVEGPDGQCLTVNTSKVTPEVRIMPDSCSYSMNCRRTCWPTPPSARP